MESKEKCWKTEEGELHFDFASNIWTFISGSRKVFITPWRETEKGPMTEIFLTDGEKQVILEILEKQFNKELFLPEQADETMKKVIELCKNISSIDTSDTEYWMSASLKPCVKELILRRSDEIRAIHTYYGNGLFFGMKMGKFGKIQEFSCIPSRCMEFPGTRLDAID